MNTDLIIANLLSPPVLFFALGIAAKFLRSDLEIPNPIPTLFSLYLLWAIGYKGGVKLHEAGLAPSTIVPLAVAVVFSAVTPIWVAPLLAIRFKGPDAAACAAAFGSVSAVTFITAANFLDAQRIDYGGHMVAALALMEAPAVIVAVMLYRKAHPAPDPSQERPDAKLPALLAETLRSGPVFLLLGALLVGLFAGQRGFDQLRPFTEDVFYGMLVLFLLDAGMNAADKISGLKEVGLFALAAGIVIPLINAALALGITFTLSLIPGFSLNAGDAFLLMILSASASYIAVPATMRLAMPEANPGIYLPVALGITFPFNIALGIPLYLFCANLVAG